MRSQRFTRATGRLRTITATTMLFSGLATAAAHGQPAVAVGDALSLQEAVRLAIEREPGLRADRTEVDVALGNVSQAGLKPNPMVSVARQQQPGGMDNQTTVTMELPLDLFRAPGRVSVAEREVDAVRFWLADRERLLVAEVRAAYGAVAAAQRELEVLRELADTAGRQIEVTRGRVEAGATPPLDRDLLTVERQRIDADRLLQGARAVNAMLNLGRLLGLSPSDRLTLADSLESLVDEASAPPISSIDVVAQRSDIREAEASVRIADASLDRARRSGRFDVSLFGTYTRMRTAFPQLGYGPGGNLQPVGDVFHYLAAGATFTVPWRNNNRGEIASSVARRLGAEARREAVDLQARSEVASAIALDEKTRAVVALYAKEIRPLARHNVEVVRQTYEMGRGTVADVLGEQRRYLDIERAYTDTLKQAYDARTSLLSALGAQP